jgi:hypothetical protein
VVDGSSQLQIDAAKGAITSGCRETLEGKLTERVEVSGGLEWPPCPRFAPLQPSCSPLTEHYGLWYHPEPVKDLVGQHDGAVELPRPLVIRNEHGQFMPGSRANPLGPKGKKT